MSKKILLLEDDIFLQRVYKSKFEKSGYEVEALKNSKNADSKIAEFDPDVIVTDVIMPEADGYSLLQKLNEKDKKLPVVVVTNLTQEEDVKKLSSLGAKKVLSKSSTSFEDLLTAVKELLAN